MLVPVQHLHVATEITRQYQTLVAWQVVGFLIVLDGPILLAFLYVTNLIPMMLAASVLFPVAVGIFPTAALVGLVHAVFRKPALRQQIAQMGVDSHAWATPLELPLRRFWVVTSAFTGAIVMLGILLHLTRGHQNSGREYTQRTAPTVYDWGIR